jgi:3',5'-cyclic AMP phosphodiesterase CpdA
MMISRRTFLRHGSLCLAGLGAGARSAADPGVEPLLRIGLMTDLHYADKPPGGTRFYREALTKLDEAVAHFNRTLPDLVIELGDLVDQADTVDKEIEWLESIEQHFSKLVMPRHYVLGNHCVTTLTKEEFARHSGSTGGHSAFDAKGLRILILDSCFREDGTAYGRRNFHWQDANLPKAELAWLEAELQTGDGPVVVMAHQRLDAAPNHGVRNAAEIRALLEKSGRVLAVFQGHSHQNDYQRISGIHYVTLVAMVEGTGMDQSGYTVLEVLPDSSLRLHGLRRQASHELGR